MYVIDWVGLFWRYEITNSGQQVSFHPCVDEVFRNPRSKKNIHPSTPVRPSMGDLLHKSSVCNGGGWKYDGVVAKMRDMIVILFLSMAKVFFVS